MYTLTGDDMKISVAMFKQYPFTIGQKIHIEDGPRKGDWEVVSLDDKKVELRCPVSGIQVSWARFCYLSSEQLAEWPQKES